MSVIITALFIYPIKSCSGIAVDTLCLDALGAVNDRRYMLVDEDGQFVTQRRYAQLVHVQLQAHDQGWRVSLPGQQSRILPFTGMQAKTCLVTVWSDNFLAYDQGDEWAAFFSHFLGKKVRLVFTGMDTSRTIDHAYSPETRQVGFADGFPLLLTNEQSLSLLNRQLESPVAMHRFRPNIVVDGAAPFAENGWQALAFPFPNMKLAVVKPCSRCVIPTINTVSGEKEPYVWKVLEENCKAADGKVYFGQNIIHQSEGMLLVGQIADVL